MRYSTTSISFLFLEGFTSLIHTFQMLEMNIEDKNEEMCGETSMEIVTETEDELSNTRMNSENLNSPPPSKTQGKLY